VISHARAARAAELEQQANAAFYALRENDAHAAERAELRAAGVAERVIETLFPYEFFDLAPSIKASITPASFNDNAMVQDHHWDSLSNTIRYHVGKFSAAVQDELLASCSVGINDHRDVYDELYLHIESALPKSSNRRLGANTALYSLMKTCWLMNRSLTATRKLNWNSVHQDFVQTLARTMPDFLNEHAPAAKAKA
jgi:hypothetical protein